MPPCLPSFAAWRCIEVIKTEHRRKRFYSNDGSLSRYLSSGNALTQPFVATYRLAKLTLTRSTVEALLRLLLYGGQTENPSDQ